MANQVAEQTEQKPVKRFTSYEDFLKEFYPRSAEDKAREAREENGDFGGELALESLNRHASSLRFGED
jgi:hypothetical protein